MKCKTLVLKFKSVALCYCSKDEFLNCCQLHRLFPAGSSYNKSTLYSTQSAES
eukprot:m.9236 g.9236  ORF g.9236 m.9236 type:complete len:53 (+) comp21203_c0_seq1:41-199(+)